MKTEGFGELKKMKNDGKKFDPYEYTQKYHRENYCRMNIVLTRKEMREELKEAAIKEGKSLNRFILDALKEKLDRM